ncbi:cytochrome ubiquinol oxidase subunit I [Azotosporobacter soli]|uniref:cytochrome ubiquinol oxidase subunit I n=1 Tax=Azotosporobacter soli TaxID=3055040 RepID=UPI0031FEE605
MSEVLLARWQFGITSTYHFLFVPLTLGLSILLAIMETMYVRTGNPLYKKMTQFWGKLFLVNFAMGVVTGIVQEFHFGMNWAEYSRFMGDIFGAPLALEALTAFFLESTFLGLWIFGWDRLSPRLHAACIWLVAFGSNLSAFWILVANSFMQSPAGYVIQNGRAEMVDFTALLTNKYVWGQFPHTLLAGLVTAGIFISAISAYYLLKGRYQDLAKASMQISLTCLLVAALATAASGHLQAQYVGKQQPMKLAAIEALWESADPAPFGIVAVIDEQAQKNTFEINVPAFLSLLVYDKPSGEIKGIKEMQLLSEQKYGPGNYIPQVTPLFWSFRIMAGAGVLMILLGASGLWLWYRNKLAETPLYLKIMLWSLPLPYLANSCGWFVTEAGRQPWIVVGLQKVSQAASTNVTSAEIWFSMIGFTLIYGVLAMAAVYLTRKFILKGPDDAAAAVVPEEKEAVLWN